MRNMPFIKQNIIVTGAGTGLGRQYALDLALNGANVVMAGRSRNVESVAEEIVALGGSAIPCVEDACEGEKIANCCLSAFGSIDAIILNAGIVADHSFKNLNQEKWDEVLNIHLNGAYSLAKAAWSPMTKNPYGHILFTTSGAGLHGNFGQANYATAKAGIIGLTKTLALEGKKHGIYVNAIAPMATTSMTSNIFTPEQLEKLTSKTVSKVAMAMIHPDYRQTGQIIEAGGNWARAYRWQRSEAGYIATGSVDDIVDRLTTISTFEGENDYPTSTIDSLSSAIK